MLCLAINFPKVSDAHTFSDFFIDIDIRKALFPHLNYLNYTEYSLAFIKNWISINEQKGLPFLRVIRIVDDIIPEESWNETNSQLVGFLVYASAKDSLHNSGFEYGLSFAVKSNFRNKGIATQAVKMTEEWMNNEGYDYVICWVKPSKLASHKVLKKLNFDIATDNLFGTAYTKRLNMNLEKYNNGVLLSK